MPPSSVLESRLGVALQIVSSHVVDRGVTDRAVLRPAFDDVERLARSTDADGRELAVLYARLEVAPMLQLMLDQPALFRPFTDRVMRVVLDLPTGEVTWVRWIQRYVTTVFLHFVQGITMFVARGDIPGAALGRPAYHRASSCGPWTPANPGASRAFERDHLTCDVGLPPAELERRRRNVWTCLVERLVYSKLYAQFVGPQDVGHLVNERRVTQQLFETCFALHHIAVVSVKLTFDPEHGVPDGMILAYSTPDHSITERYERTPTGGRRYEMDVRVRVRREVRPLRPDDGAGDEYERVQSYLQAPGEWLPVSPGAPPPPRRGGSASGRRFVPNCPNPVDPWHGVEPRATASRSRRKNGP